MRCINNKQTDFQSQIHPSRGLQQSCVSAESGLRTTARQAGRLAADLTGAGLASQGNAGTV